MEEKEPIKMSLKIAILLFTIVLVCIGVIVFCFFYNRNTNNTNNTNINANTNKNSATNTNNQEPASDSQNAYKKVSINGSTYYQRNGNTKWEGEYNQDEFYTAEALNIKEVVSYQDYVDRLKNVVTNDNKELEPYYSDKKSNYIILAYSTGYSWCEMDLIDVLEKDDEIIIYGDEEINGVMADGSGYFIAIPTDMPVGTEIKYRECYSKKEIDSIFVPIEDLWHVQDDKPIIYLYPTEDTEISVKLLKPGNITCSYPKYSDEWKVLAKPNGDLIDLDSGRNLYSLYYECKNELKTNITNEGFVVKSEDTIKFLEEKLAILGLTEREAEEFIVYWLPKLESNKYNYIRFASIDEINENMPLEFSSKPDSLIRVLMIFKDLDEPIEVQEQKLETPSRNGFVAVEWGGSEIK